MWGGVWEMRLIRETAGSCGVGGGCWKSFRALHAALKIRASAYKYTRIVEGFQVRK